MWAHPLQWWLLYILNLNWTTQCMQQKQCRMVNMVTEKQRLPVGLMLLYSRHRSQVQQTPWKSVWNSIQLFPHACTTQKSPTHSHLHNTGTSQMLYNRFSLLTHMHQMWPQNENVFRRGLSHPAVGSPEPWPKWDTGESHSAPSHCNRVNDKHFEQFRG